MKYEEEIDTILRELLFEEWMTDDEYNDVISLTFEKIGKTKEDLSNDLDFGVKNGYPIKLQLDILKEIL